MAAPSMGASPVVTPAPNITIPMDATSVFPVTAKNLGPFWTGTEFYFGQYRLKKFFYQGTCVAAAEKIIIAT